MEPDKEGFIQPKINKDLCNNCGLCHKVCPVYKKIENEHNPHIFAALNNSDDIREISSSGGIFYTLAREILSEDGIVFGVKFNEKLDVIHSYTDKESQISEFCGSKYVQSNINNSYSDAEKFLKEGKQVLFTGTPCQIAGLKSYLKKDYPNLLTQDFICHGVPTPKAWEKYKELLEKNYQSKIEKAQFRNKSLGWQKYSMLIKFKSEEIYSESVLNDAYLKGFISDIFLRNSCFNCVFKNNNFKSDITLADFWGIDNVLPQINDNKGVSLIIIHTEKGMQYIENIKDSIRLIKVEKEEALKSNISYYKSTPYNLMRNTAIKDLDKMPFDKVIDKYLSLRIKSKIRRKIYKILTKFIKKERQ